MITDILTVMWKEWRDIAIFRGGIRGGVLGQLVMVVVFGVLLPAQFREGSVVLPAFLAVWAPFLATGTLTADSFAGERERRTLETLLASRLPDRAILFGKIATTVCYAWGMTLVILSLGVTTANVTRGHGSPVIVPVRMMLGTAAIGLLTAVLMSATGVLVSLKAATVRQAAQTLSLGFLAFALIPLIGPMLPREWLDEAYVWSQKTGPAVVVGYSAAALLLADIVMLKVAAAKFVRAKLILE